MSGRAFSWRPMVLQWPKSWCVASSGRSFSVFSHQQESGVMPVGVPWHTPAPRILGQHFLGKNLRASRFIHRQLATGGNSYCPWTTSLCGQKIRRHGALPADGRFVEDSNTPFQEVKCSGPYRVGALRNGVPYSQTSQTYCKVAWLHWSSSNDVPQSSS